MTRRVQYQVQTEPVLTPTAVTWGWFEPFSEPTRVRRAPADAVFGSFEGALAWGWFEPFSEPTRVRRSPADAAFETINPTYFSVTWGWLEPLSEPPPIRRSPSDAAFETLNPTYFTTTWGWLEPLSEPPPIRRSPSDAFFENATTPPVPPPTFGWFGQLSDPVRVPLKPILVSISGFQAEPEAVYESKWHQPWSEPVRVPPRDAFFQFFAWEPQIVATVGELGWKQAWSEPVRTPPRDAFFEFFTRPPLIIVGSVPVDQEAWRQWWSEPVRTPPRSPFFDFFTGPPEVITNPFSVTSSIGRAWSEPVRIPLRTAFFDYTTFLDLSFITPATVLVPRVPVYQPYRPIPKDDYSWDFFNPCVTPQFMPTTYFWTVRAPQPIDQFWSHSPPNLPPPPATVGQWFHGWDPPVRVPPRAPHFSPAAGPPVVVPLPNVVVNLVATERKDVWSMTFTESVLPFTARVGIVERLRATGQVATASLDAGNVGVIESDF